MIPLRPPGLAEGAGAYPDGTATQARSHLPTQAGPLPVGADLGRRVHFAPPLGAVPSRHQPENRIAAPGGCGFGPGSWTGTGGCDARAVS